MCPAIEIQFSQPIPHLHAAWKNPTLTTGPVWGEDSGWDGRNHCSLPEVFSRILADRTESQSWKSAKQASSLGSHRTDGHCPSERGILDRIHALDGRGYGEDPQRVEAAGDLLPGSACCVTLAKPLTFSGLYCPCSVLWLRWSQVRTLEVSVSPFLNGADLQRACKGLSFSCSPSLCMQTNPLLLTNTCRKPGWALPAEARRPQPQQGRGEVGSDASL